MSHDHASGQTLIISAMHPNMALDVRNEGGPGTLCIQEYEEGKVSQLWRYKNNYFFNQGMVMDIPWSSDEPGTVLGTYSRHGEDNQIFYVVQSDE